MPLTKQQAVLSILENFRTALIGCRIIYCYPFHLPLSNFKRPKNLEDSSDFDDFWTELIVMTWSFILATLHFFLFFFFSRGGSARRFFFREEGRRDKKHFFLKEIETRSSRGFFEKTPRRRKKLRLWPKSWRFLNMAGAVMYCMSAFSSAIILITL